MESLPTPSDLSTTTLHCGSWLTLCSVSLVLGQKSIKGYEYIDRPLEKQPNKATGSVSIVPIIRYSDKAKKLAIIANFRPPVGNYVLEFPGGIVESESFEADAFRELKEETGFTGK